MITVEKAELLVKTPDPVGAVFGTCGYSRSTGREMIFQYQVQRMSDVADENYYIWSEDNGKTWSVPVQVFNKFDPAKDKPITLPSGDYIDGWPNPFTHERILIKADRVKPDTIDSDIPQTFWQQTSMLYALSTDDGRSHGPYRPIVKPGKEYRETHPFDGLYMGQNQVYGIHAPLFIDQDTILVPLELSVLGVDGKIFNPCNSYDFSQIVILIGRRDGDGFIWDSGQPLLADPYTQSTRGFSEPTLAQLDDGSILMVLRGSNEGKPEIPSYKWFTISRDRGKTWSAIEPWTFDDGAAFFSPSSTCILIGHSDGRLFWFGNIIPKNGQGNSPRYPLVVGEVDRNTGKLIRSSVTLIADRSPDQSDRLQLSNFSLYEDRETRQLVLDVPHFYPAGGKDRRGWGDAWTGNIFRYRINLHNP
jgi:hypothetical protein